MNRRAWSCLLLLLSPAAFAATRGQYGGTLRVSLSGEAGPTDPLLADAPADAAVLELTSRPVCQLDRNGRVVPVLAQDLQRASSSELKVVLRPGLRTPDGRALDAQQLAQAWMRLQAEQSRSPYRALLYPLRGEGRFLSTGSATTLPLNLRFPWPDLERSLCHPALAVAQGTGPFEPARAPGVYVMSAGYPGGRPYAERLTALYGDARAASRLLALNDAEVGLGVGADNVAPLPPPPALYATYLAFQPDRVGAGFRDSVERLIDRGDLARIFVRAPSVPMSSLLPPALMPQQPAPHLLSHAPPPDRELTLLYDASSPDQKGVAERLQVKLHDAGYRVALHAVSRPALRARWASRDFDLMLHAVLLPPVAAPAFAVVLDTAGRYDLLARELPAIGAVSDPALRDARVRQRAQALQPNLPLIPLYAQGLRVTVSSRVEGLEVDGFGIPLLDGAFFGGR